MVDQQSRVNDLEKENAELKEERDKLYKDVESLCMQTSSSFWNGSSVMYERISQAEADLERTQKERERLNEHVAKLKEEVNEFRELRLAAEEVSKGEKEKNHVLEKELAFYKQRGAHWIEERNLHMYELEELKRTTADLEQGLADIKAELDNEKEQRKRAEDMLGEKQQEAAKLERRLVECARIPDLEKTIQESNDENQRLSKEVKDLEDKLEERNGDLEKSQLQLEEAMLSVDSLKHESNNLRGSAEMEKTKLAEQVNDHEAEILALRSQLESHSLDLGRADETITSAKAQAELIVMEKDRELEEAHESYKFRISELESQLEKRDEVIVQQAATVEEVKNAKLKALMNLEQAQTETSELRSLLSQATAQNANGTAPHVESNGSDRPVRGNWFRGQGSVQG